MVGRVYRAGEEDVIIEAWPTPRKLRPKVDRLELISPSGVRYKVSEIDNFPMSQLGAKRAAYKAEKRRALAFLADWAVGTAWADCGPGHESGGGESGSGGGRDDSGEAYAGFGLLVGMAAGQEKEWISAGRLSGVKAEPGLWKLSVTVLDDKNRQHAFTVPFELTKLSTGTAVPAGGGRRTFVDPETGLHITEWSNPDGSVTRRAEDEHGNWSEGNRFPGGKKNPPAAAPEPDPAPAPEPEPAPAPQEDPGPPPPAPKPADPGPTGPVTTGDDGGSIFDDFGPTLYGEDIDEDGKVGILLQREDHDWVPSFGGNTNVYAKIYEPDKTRPGVWKPSKKKRQITVRFVERSNEPGRCMNRDVDVAPEDSPDIFMKEENNIGTTCSDDPSGFGLFGECVTKDKHDQYTFMVQSHDFGAYSKMEATCEDCVQLVPVYGGTRPPRFPDAVEEGDREKRLVRVPKDTNDNQISDGYAPDRKNYNRPEDDDEDTPKGNGVKGDGLSKYEEYRGFYDKYGSHQRLSWEKKDLFIQNIFGLPGVDTFETVSGLDITKVDPEHFKKRVVNFNHGHAHVVDQHGLILIEMPATGDGLLGYTAGNEFGPPKYTTRVEIYPGNHKSSSVEDTVVHELGHAVGIRHHGDTDVWWEEFYPPGTWRDYNPFAGLTIAGVEIAANTHDAATLCAKDLPATVLFGKKHNQSSGAVDCYMRYEYHGEAFRQEDGSIHCIPDHPGFTGFCAVSMGTGFNAGDRVAGNPTVGSCKTQLVINDLAD